MTDNNQWFEVAIVILAAYDADAAREIEQDARHGIDVTDALYEALTIHDEDAAEAYLNHEGGSA